MGSCPMTESIPGEAHMVESRRVHKILIESSSEVVGFRLANPMGITGNTTEFYRISLDFVGFRRYPDRNLSAGLIDLGLSRPNSYHSR